LEKPTQEIKQKIDLVEKRTNVEQASLNFERAEAERKFFEQQKKQVIEPVPPKSENVKKPLFKKEKIDDTSRKKVNEKKLEPVKNNNKIHKVAFEPELKTVQKESFQSKKRVAEKLQKNSLKTKDVNQPPKVKAVQEQLNSTDNDLDAAPILTVEAADALEDREVTHIAQTADGLVNRDALAKNLLQPEFDETSNEPSEVEQVEQPVIHEIVPEALRVIYKSDELDTGEEEPVIDEINRLYDSQEADQPEQLITLEIDEKVVSFVAQAETALEEAEPKVIVRAEAIFNEIESIIIESELISDETIEHVETVDIDTEEAKLAKITLLVTELSETLNLDYTEEEIAVIAASFLDIRQKLQASTQYAYALPDEKGTREFKLSTVSSQVIAIKKSLKPTHTFLGFIALAKKIELQLQLNNLSKATSI
jgi:flagellin-specific chaperone FliS